MAAAGPGILAAVVPEWTTAAFRAKVAKFVREFALVMPEGPPALTGCVNVLVIGGQGVGKSSFINAVLTASQADNNGTEKLRRIVNQALSSSSQNHVTTQADRYFIGTNVRLIDVPGFKISGDDELSGDNFKKALDVLLKNRELDGKDLIVKARDLEEKVDKARAATRPLVANEAHAVLIVTALPVANALDTAGAAHREYLKDLVKKTLVRGITPTVVITKCDKAAALAEMPEAEKMTCLWALVEVVACRKLLAEVTGLDLLHVIPVWTYNSFDAGFFPLPNDLIDATVNFAMFTALGKATDHFINLNEGRISRDSEEMDKLPASSFGQFGFAGSKFGTKK